MESASPVYADMAPDADVEIPVVKGRSRPKLSSTWLPMSPPNKAGLHPHRGTPDD
jgi:hypothetical protein